MKIAYKLLVFVSYLFKEFLLAKKSIEKVAKSFLQVLFQPFIRWITKISYKLEVLTLKLLDSNVHSFPSPTSFVIF